MSRPTEGEWVKERDEARAVRYLEVAEEFIALVREAQGEPFKVDMGRRLMLWARKAAK